jgi:hypothetical protein
MAVEVGFHFFQVVVGLPLLSVDLGVFLFEFAVELSDFFLFAENLFVELFYPFAHFIHNVLYFEGGT